VNDGLMVIFFLLVGLEIKRELLIGELASLRRATLPLAAAIGGMAVPALLYFALNAGRAGAAGWGIPMATDIAFAVGVLSLVGRAVPTSVKVFLLAIAIIDDLGAVVVIAAFYSGRLSGAALAVAGAFFAALVALNRLRVQRALPYMLLGVGLWAATLYSGIHATIAGVLLAFTLPATRQADDERDRVQTPLARVEHALLRPVNFLIVPLFALANAGVDLRAAASGAALGSPVTWGVLLGLMIGKPVGVLLASWAAIKIRVASLPHGATGPQLVGVAVLCGIGFTMSLFVANLAFPQQAAHLAAAKIGILGASLVCGVAGGAIIAAAGRRR
jgi:NhaA family Na+:H+ antiporter